MVEWSRAKQDLNISYQRRTRKTTLATNSKVILPSACVYVGPCPTLDNSLSGSL